MKKILFIVIFLISCPALNAQTGTGWTNMRAKYNFRDSVNINNGWKIGGTIVAPSITEINYVDGVTSAIQTQLNSVAGRIQDSIQRNALFTQDYYITEASGTVYAIPHPKTAYTATSDTNLTPVLQHCLDQLTTGGKIYIAEGTYDHMDTVVVRYDYTTIEGAEKFKTKLRAKANIDAGKKMGSTFGFIQVICKDYFTIRDLDVDGNGANQTYIDNGVGLAEGRFHGIYIYVNWVLSGHGAPCTDTCDYPLVENVYVHDFPGAAGLVMLSKNGEVRGSTFIDNYSNGITSYGLDNVIEDCYFEGSGDVGATMFGRGVIRDCIARDNDGVKGTTNTQWGFGIEGTSALPQHISIIDNKVIGNHKIGIGVYSNGRDIKISGNDISGLYNTVTGANGIVIDEGYGVMVSDNYIHDWNDNGTGIVCTSDTLTSILTNKVIGLNTANSYGISLSSSYLASIMGNDVRTAGGGAGIYINGDNNIINMNTAIGVSGISLTATADNNIVSSNTCTGTSANYDIYDLGTGNIKVNNYGINKANPIVARGTNIVAPVTIKKIIGGVGVTECDYNFATAANMNEQVITMTSIVPAKSRILNVQTYTEATFTGATTLVAETGTASSSDDLIASATIYAVNAITATANGGVFIAVPSASAVSVYVSATPGANWSNVTAGKVTVYVTYLPYN